MSYGMFDDLAVNDASVQKREARVTQTRDFEMAVFASRERFMPFLKNANTKQDLNDRLALVGNDLAKVISEHLTPVPAVMRRVRGALKTEWESTRTLTRKSAMWEAEGNTMTLYGSDGEAFGTVTYYAEDSLGPESWEAEILGGQAQTFTSQDDAEEWLEEQQQKLSNKSKKTAWSFDRSLNAYALGSGTFDGYNCTECNAHHSKMGMSRCACGKIWNAWEVNSKGKTSSGPQYFFREVPRRDTILARRRDSSRIPTDQSRWGEMGNYWTSRIDEYDVLIEKSTFHWTLEDEGNWFDQGDASSFDEAVQAAWAALQKKEPAYSRRKKADSPEDPNGPEVPNEPEALPESRPEEPSGPQKPQQNTINRPAPGEEDQAWEDSVISDIKSKLMELIEQESGEAVLRGIPVDTVLQPLVDAMRAIEGIERAEQAENAVLQQPEGPVVDERDVRDQMSPEEMQFAVGYKAGWKDTPLPKEAGQRFLEGYIKGSNDAILNDLGTSSDEDKSFREKLQDAIEVLREDTGDAIDEDNNTPRDEEPFAEPAFSCRKKSSERPDWSYTDQFQDVTSTYGVPSGVRVEQYPGNNFHVRLEESARDGIFLTNPSMSDIFDAAGRLV